MSISVVKIQYKYAFQELLQGMRANIINSTGDALPLVGKSVIFDILQSLTAIILLSLFIKIYKLIPFNTHQIPKTKMFLNERTISLFSVRHIFYYLLHSI